jgi:SAM-dependent methyltransferase
VRITQCNSCSLYFTDPIYKPLFISSLYDHLYSGEGHTTSLPKPDELASLKGNCFELSDKYCGDRIQAIKKYDFGQNLLEIGSSWGYFLYQAKQQGFDVTGVEISEPRRLFGINNLGVDIVESLNHLNGRLFDIIYTAHTLEHFTDLSTIFGDLARLLHVGGKLIIEVPNFDYTEFGKRALYTIGAVHPLGFSSEFFRVNLPKYNFKIIGFYNSWESFPKNPIVKSEQDVIIVLAEKES